MNGKILMALGVMLSVSSQGWASDTKTTDLSVTGESLHHHPALGSRRDRTYEPEAISSTFNNLTEFTVNFDRLHLRQFIELKFAVELEAIQPICGVLGRANIKKLVINDPAFSDEAAQALVENFPKSITSLIVLSDKLSSEGRKCLEGVEWCATLNLPGRIPH